MKESPGLFLARPPDRCGRHDECFTTSVTLEQDISHKDFPVESAAWYREPKNRRHFSEHFRHCGYTREHNKTAKDRLWRVEGRRQTVYARRELSRDDRHKAVQRVVKQK